MEALLDPTVRRFALAVLIASLFFPVQGLGVDLCMLHALTKLPCPGCGMSRAVSAISQGDWTAALGLNPFALLVWPTFAGLSILLVLPQRWSRAVEERLRRSQVAGRAYRLAFTAFVVFGMARLATFATLGASFP